jgi:hypothetical protein
MFPYWEQRIYTGKFGGFLIRSVIFNREIVFKTSIFDLFNRAKLTRANGKR